MKKSEFEIEATSSEELSNIEGSDSTDVRNTIEKWDFFLQEYKAKKTEYFYVAEITDVKEEHYSVKFLKNIAHSNKFLYDKEETYDTDIINIVFKLPKPQSVGASVSMYVAHFWSKSFKL
ncbi:hypothetical protein TNCT_28011 [Trichonephila clavata]|uniref:Uncharacterized protein n=1 Tax=Trichonephila clavata TaxID=2740835 RepID=A0A8X6HGW1_TRICU|nr:hypothetical protein TNCT_28011 [Trichonephila clavata]